MTAFERAKEEIQELKKQIKLLAKQRDDARYEVDRLTKERDGAIAKPQGLPLTEHVFVFDSRPDGSGLDDGPEDSIIRHPRPLRAHQS
jgi:hypothetical protein